MAEIYLTREQRWQLAWKGALNLAGRNTGATIVLTPEGEPLELGGDTDWLEAEPFPEAKLCIGVADLLGPQVCSRAWGTVQHALLAAANLLDAELPDAVQCEADSQTIRVGYYAAAPAEPEPERGRSPDFLVDVVGGAAQCGILFPLGLIYATALYLVTKLSGRKIDVSGHA